MKRLIFAAAIVTLGLASCGQRAVFNMADYGILPDTGEDMSPLFEKAMADIKERHGKASGITIKLEPGRYEFHPDNSSVREYYISNHDQDNPKHVGIALEDMDNVVFDGNGAELVFHGRMLPMSVIGSDDVTLRNFSIDFANPHISQVEIISNNGARGITFRPAPWVDFEVRNGDFIVKGEGWEHCPFVGMAFESDTRHVLYRTSDISVNVRGVRETADGTVYAPGWKDERLVPGTVVTMRTYGRPTPGIFVSDCEDLTLNDIKVHYAEGMGLLAQMSENLTLDGFSVCLKGEDDPRYFTTQADATHFSGCRGRIISRNGLYENMMDDAINVHGTYLKVTGREDDYTLTGRYMHYQSYGFTWGYPGDEVQFIASKTMEIIGEKNRIKSICPADTPSDKGAKTFRITFSKPLDPAISPDGDFGMENLTWTPEVLFEDNIVRNNRARGALFSTPKKVTVQDNLFDHTSGTGILLCGDCNGWFETGACKDVTIRGNTFINALTNMFQFTNAIISIYPEIPDLEGQKQYFHSNITIEDNIFETFDHPVLYAKSVCGLVFRDNVIRTNSDYKPFHWNSERYLLEHVKDCTIEDNQDMASGTDF